MLVFGAQDVSISRHDFILEMLGMVWIALGILQQKSPPHRSKGSTKGVLPADWL